VPLTTRSGNPGVVGGERRRAPEQSVVRRAFDEGLTELLGGLTGPQELVRLHRMDTGDREGPRRLQMSPNTERGNRQALEAAGLLKELGGDVPELEVPKRAVLEHLPSKVAPQQVSSPQAWFDTRRYRGEAPRRGEDLTSVSSEGHLSPA
jgi:hypothetical protein